MRSINYLGLIVISMLFTSCNRSIPENWKGIKLYNMVDGRDYIIINNDNTFLLHEYIPNSDQTWEWTGRVDNLKLITDKNLSYQGSNDYKATEIDPQMQWIKKSFFGEHLQIDFTGFNTISGHNEIEKRRYSTKNVSPY